MGILDGRQSERYDFTEEVIVDDQVFTNCVDISSSGLFVHTVKPFTLNSIVSITIPSYGFTAHAIVKHFKPGVGIGLEFHQQNDLEKEQIKQIIDNIKLTSKKREKLTVLMIDGKKQLRAVYKNRLSLDGYSVVDAEDGMEAIKAMNSFRIHAIISELEVKRIELSELLKMIREAPGYQTIPIFVIATPTGYDIESWVLDCGANKYLPRASTSASELSSLLSVSLSK